MSERSSNYMMGSFRWNKSQCFQFKLHLADLRQHTLPRLADNLAQSDCNASEIRSAQTKIYLSLKWLVVLYRTVSGN